MMDEVQRLLRQVNGDKKTTDVISNIFPLNKRIFLNAFFELPKNTLFCIRFIIKSGKQIFKVLLEIHKSDFKISMFALSGPLPSNPGTSMIYGS